MRKVIVSGGNGFLGSSLAMRLSSAGVEVHAIVNENHQRLDKILPAECIHMLRDGVGSAVELVRRIEPDTIYHLAAVYSEPVSSPCILSMIDGNLTLGSCMLFAATQCRTLPVFINTGTYWQFDAEASYSPNTLYAATKQAFQDILHFYRSRLGLRAVTLILYDTFGEGDTRRKLWARLAMAPPGSSIALSPGEQTIHLVHIQDVMEAFVRAAELLHAGTTLGAMYSVSAAKPAKLRWLVEALNAEGHLELDLKWGEAPYWEGQVLEPWVGDMLPGWSAKTEVLPALVCLAGRKRQEDPEGQGAKAVHGSEGV